MSEHRLSPVSPTIPLDQSGIHQGHLRLPHSRDDSAWGNVMIPIAVIANGEGPTALITGGNHGDEYEGPLAILDFLQSLDLAAISGRVILVPFFNHPAVEAATRTSPIDGGNLNRAFPGQADGTVTQKIADYFQHHLLPLADVVLDFHSGGKTLDFLPFAASHVLDDKQQEARCRAARDAFNAPWSVEMREIDSVGMYDDAAEAMGKTFVTTEIGGGGTSTATSVSIASRGLKNVLIHAGILAGEIERRPSHHISQPEGCFAFAVESGMIEFCADLGDTCTSGETIARIWRIDRTGSAPREIAAPIDGILIARHFPGLVQSGDCVAVMGVDDGPNQGG